MTSKAEPLRIRVYRNLDELESLLPSWQELLAAYPLATTFSTWEWLSAWWRAFGNGRELLVLSFLGPNSELVGLAPLSIEPHAFVPGLPLRLLRLMGDGSHDSDNLDLPVRCGWEEMMVDGLLSYLRRHKSWDVAEFNTVPPNSPVLGELIQKLRGSGWTISRRERAASAISLPNSFNTYFQQLSSEDRKNLGRYTRRLERRYQTRIYRCIEQADLPRCLEALFRLHQGRWQAAGEPGTFASEERRHFYYDLSPALLARGWLQFWVLELDDTIAAVQYGFRYKDTVFHLQEGFDNTRSSDRLGFILRGRVIEQLIADGVQKYDFLGGEPGYKARWLAQAGYYTHVHFARPHSVGSVYLRGVVGAKAGKNWLREHLPNSAWGLLHKLSLRVRGMPAKNLQAPQNRDANPEERQKQLDTQLQSSGAEKK
jgi:CelD/BcsL family acetyltransferase involved in cellulose biosynthesis